MLGLVYDEAASSLILRHDYPKPVPGSTEALIKVLRAGICSTDLEITRGYVPGFKHVLGHEFVGIVESCAVSPQLVGKRVVGEINCNICGYSCADAVFTRNHAPGRTVLGIVGKDGTAAEYLTLPATNLHVVPDEVSDEEAVYAEPLAAAARIVEQGVVKAAALRGPHPGRCRVAVIGDGKLGLLVAQVLAEDGGADVELIGRHASKMGLVTGLHAMHLGTDDAAMAELQGVFDVCVEASGSSQGIRLASKITRSMGSLVLKSTVSLKDPDMPGWSEIANDIVVNEKVLVGSRCGPIDEALRLMAVSEPLRKLLRSMTTHVVPLSDAVEGMKLAANHGVIKVQLLCS